MGVDKRENVGPKILSNGIRYSKNRPIWKLKLKFFRYSEYRLAIAKKLQHAMEILCSFRYSESDLTAAKTQKPCFLDL